MNKLKQLWQNDIIIQWFVTNIKKGINYTIRNWDDIGTILFVSYGFWTLFLWINVPKGKLNIWHALIMAYTIIWGLFMLFMIIAYIMDFFEWLSKKQKELKEKHKN